VCLHFLFLFSPRGKTSSMLRKVTFHFYNKTIIKRIKVFAVHSGIDLDYTIPRRHSSVLLFWSTRWYP
jgi:hypothetical protein